MPPFVIHYLIGRPTTIVVLLQHIRGIGVDGVVRRTFLKIVEADFYVAVDIGHHLLHLVEVAELVLPCVVLRLVKI